MAPIHTVKMQTADGESLSIGQTVWIRRGWMKKKKKFRVRKMQVSLFMETRSPDFVYLTCECKQSCRRPPDKIYAIEENAKHGANVDP